MALERTGFQLAFEELSPGNSALGFVSIVPWDTEIFGFPVGIYRVGAEELEASARKRFGARFLEWAQGGTVLASMWPIPANEAHALWKTYLGEADFRFVDFSIQATLNGLQTARLRPGAAWNYVWPVRKTAKVFIHRHGVIPQRAVSR